MSESKVRKESPHEAASPSKKHKPSAVDYDFEPPSDWPKDGDIDLAVHDLPHDSAGTEWWYVNGHCKSACGRNFSYFASFFRMSAEYDAKADTMKHVHSLTWAIVDADNKTYLHDPVLDHESADYIKKSLEKNEYGIDGRLGRAFLEVVSKNKVPLPDRLATKAAIVSRTDLNLVYDDQIFFKDENGNYHVKCQNEEKGIALDLVLSPNKKPTRQGHNGIVKVGIKQETMFYYFIPRNDATGTLTVGGKKLDVSGTGWYDHEFGGSNQKDKYLAEQAKLRATTPPAEEKKYDYAWNWLAVQLEDGTDITATTLVESTTLEVFDQYTVIVDPDSSRAEFHDIEFKGTESWMSIRTTCDYPQMWTLTSQQGDLSLRMKSAFPEQEFMTLISKPAFWEGRLEVEGTLRGRPVKGLAFLERHGHSKKSTNSMEYFFKRISAEVLRIVAQILPLKPDYAEALRLMAGEDAQHYMDGADLQVFGDTVCKPLRTIVDRGGKSWRSFAFLLCIDCVGGDSEMYRHWLAMPEIMHVGSLIIDDIQDKSDVRRGGQAAHLMYGDAIAINAGTAGYFISLDTLINMNKEELTLENKLKMYELYFLTLRGGHAGQAFDINGLDYLMEEAVAKGGNTLERTVLCTHRLKSAIAAGNLARMGSIIGGGSDEQVRKIGGYFEAIGLAFQIVDDVLNLRGFEGNTKARGEDIVAGKVTFPVAKAMSLLDAAERRRVWDVVRSKPQDQKVVDSVCETLERCGALPQSMEHANTIVRDAWAEVDKVVPDSYHKLLLRAFAWFVLERHY
jgi:geranylgeranyl pyrophosphate synthase/predicted secreted hydrolase